MSGYDSISPILESEIVGDRGLVAVAVWPDCLVVARVLARLDCWVVQQADWSHQDVDDATGVKWAT